MHEVPSGRPAVRGCIVSNCNTRTDDVLLLSGSMWQGLGPWAQGCVRCGTQRASKPQLTRSLSANSQSFAYAIPNATAEVMAFHSSFQICVYGANR